MVTRHPDERAGGRPRCCEVVLALADRHDRVGLPVQQDRADAGGQQRNRVGLPVALRLLRGGAADERVDRPATEPLAGPPGERGNGGLRHEQRRPSERPRPGPSGRYPGPGAQPQRQVPAGRVPDDGDAGRVDAPGVPARGQEVVGGRRVGERRRPGLGRRGVVDVPDQVAAAREVGRDRVLEVQVVGRPPVAAVHEDHGGQRPGRAGWYPPLPASACPGAVALDEPGRPGYDPRTRCR